VQVLGFDQREIITGTWFLERIHPDDCARFKELVSGVSPDNPSFSAVFRFMRPDGRELWLEKTSKAEFDFAGRLLRIKGLTLDITERRQHDAAAVESEERLQEALAAGAVMAFDWEVSTDLTRRSNNAAQILGLEPQQTLNGASFLARVHPDDLARMKALWSTLNRDNPTCSIIYRFLRLDGREIWLHEISKAEHDAAGQLIRFKGLARDITERKRVEEHQNVLMAELDHRVKNVLARVAMLAASTRKDSTSIDEYLRALNGRIQSMATAHSLLSRSGWQNVGLGSLVRNQLAPYATGSNVTITGKDIMLSAGEIQAVAMVLHELVTNAAKYGSLSVPNGRVRVAWDKQKLDGGMKLAIEWAELGGPPVVATAAQSCYGTRLIRDLIPHELGGTVDLVFAPDGVNCKIEIPLEPA
jgi:PAS domain S-box-containing protein